MSFIGTLSSSFFRIQAPPPQTGGESQGEQSKVSGLKLVAQKVNDELVGGHHDGCVGDLTHQVGGEPTVQCFKPLLPGHRAYCIQERAVPGAFFPQPRSHNLCTE